MCRAAGSGADPSRKPVAPMKGNVIGPGDEKRYERITFYHSGQKVNV